MIAETAEAMIYNSHFLVRLFGLVIKWKGSVHKREKAFLVTSCTYLLSFVYSAMYTIVDYLVTGESVDDDMRRGGLCAEA